MEPEKKQTDFKDLSQIFYKQQKSVGIQQYISSGEATPAITKYLLTDFIVNQIDQNQQVVSLKEKPDLQKHKNKKQQKEAVKYIMTEELSKQIAEIFGKQCAKQIETLYVRLDSGQKMSQWSTIIENVPSDKQARTKIHSFVREKLTNIESNTLQNNQMKLKFNKKMKKINPAMRKKYIHFTLFKSNIDTMGALFKLSKLTSINNKLFSSAGLKDKRGVTTQRISVYNTDVSLLKRFYNHASKNRQIWVDDIKQNLDTDIGVGDLWGNQFGLILRVLSADSVPLIETRIKSLKDKGMINYFGMQRFGSYETPTHQIGILIIQKKWQQVIQKMLLTTTKDQKADKIKQQCYYSKQYAKGQRQLPFRNKIEKNIFKGLSRFKQNYQNVFGNLPRSMRTLYCHALQSYMWNRMVSKRVNRDGFQIKVGDLVGKQLKGFDLLKKQIDQKQQIQKQDDDDQIDIEKAETQNQYQVLTINEQNIQDYSIQDVVMPLYGPTLQIPSDSFAYKMVQQQLAQLNLNESDFKANAKLLCFRGQYRKMIVKPKQVSYKIINHKQKKAELQSPFQAIGEEKHVQPGKLYSIKLHLQLPKSSYATMAIRQILHIPSSFDAQIKLNKFYDEKINDQQ